MDQYTFEEQHAIPSESIQGNYIEDNNEKYWYIKPQQQVQMNFSGKEIGIDEGNKKYRLRLIGEVDVHPLWRCEGYFPLMYRMIDDSLCLDETHHSPYSLKISSNWDNYPRRVYAKITSDDLVGEYPELKNPTCGADAFEFGIWYKKDNVIFNQDSKAKFVAEIFYQKQGTHTRDISGNPDEVHTIVLEEGSGDWEHKSIIIPKKCEIACILVYLTVESCSGTFWFEKPYLHYSSFPNLLHDFKPSNPDMREFDWLGYNLSKKEWPEFAITINNKKVFEGETYQRIYRWPAVEIEIPSGIIKNDDNQINLKLISEYREALPYKLKSIDIISQMEEFKIVSCPDIVSEGKEFSVLIYTPEDYTEVRVSCDASTINPIDHTIVFAQKGLNIVKFNALEAGGKCKLSFSAGQKTVDYPITQIVIREDDHVLTGTGDVIYINQNNKDMEYFISWYLHNQIGNSITFRPVYRWSGSRVLNKEVWSKIVKLCCEMGLYYSHMIDGRELPGLIANPDYEMMDSEYFIGDQDHERDGCYYYWGMGRSLSSYEELYVDINKRVDNRRKLNKMPYYTEHKVYPRYNYNISKNMQEAAQYFVDNVSNIKYHAKRHTGPSVLFKYFYQAGVQWLGAELMYGPHEVIIAALRGASKSYNKKEYGAHLAVQWSTSPHNTEEKYRRYYLALYICYMNGVGHINTEEGLWRMEERFADHERFDKPCVKLKEVHQKFYRFIQTHSRNGEISVPMAFLHGQDDGWVCFGRRNVWMQEGDQWKFSHPEESWDLLKVFYPKAVLNAIYRHPCPNSPQGFYSGTPYGNADITPIESDIEILRCYKILSFLGWNTVSEKQIDKLYEFVENGGILLLGLPHISTEVDRQMALEENYHIINNSKINQLIGAEINDFIDVTLEKGINTKAGEITPNTAKEIVTSKEDYPIVIENSLGTGRVIFVNLKDYPAKEGVRNIYESLLHNLGHTVLEKERQRGWLRSSDNVGFSVYDMDTPNDFRKIYFININWWDKVNNSEKVTLLWQDQAYELDVKYEDINIITIYNGWAIWTYDNETDVINILEESNGVTLLLQGNGQREFTLLNRKFKNESKQLYAKDEKIKISRGPTKNSWVIRALFNGPKTIKLQYDNM